MYNILTFKNIKIIFSDSLSSPPSSPRPRCLGAPIGARAVGGRGGRGLEGGGGRGWTVLGCRATGKTAPLAIRWGGMLAEGEVGEAPWAGDGVEEGEWVGRGTLGMALGQRSRRRPERWPEPPQTRQQTGSRHSRTGCFGERQRKQSFLRFITERDDGLEGTGVSDVSLEAGGQRLPAPGSGETDAAKSCSPSCLELALGRSRSDGGRESGERRWGQRGMLTDACGDTQGAGVAARGGGGGDGGG
jgi:hypothetical protein